MKAAISINNMKHQKEHAEAMRTGLMKHGLRVIMGPVGFPDHVVQDADFHVVWGVKRPRLIEWSKENKKPFLVMERGHLGDRMAYTSCGWNGLGRRGNYPKDITDEGTRWKHWAHLMKPWKHDGEYALLIGQVPGDASLYRLKQGFPKWAEEQAAALRGLGYQVRFRPHPLAAKLGHIFQPDKATVSTATLADDLAGASVCVSFNSTTGVEAVLAGVPTVTLDEGAMAWDVAGHKLGDTIRPDRTRWAHNLAMTQWSLGEIADGTMWDHLKNVPV